jgi:hypothetical protein
VVFALQCRISDIDVNRDAVNEQSPEQSLTPVLPHDLVKLSEAIPKTIGLMIAYTGPRDCVAVEQTGATMGSLHLRAKGTRAQSRRRRVGADRKLD